MRYFIALMFCIAFCNTTSSQSQDLFNLANGKFIDFNILFNNYDDEDTCYICPEKDDVYGYYSLYNNGEVSDNVEEIEYILLDKNLNKFANGAFKKLAAPRNALSRIRVYKTADTLVFYNYIMSITVGSNKLLGIYQKLLLKDNTLLPAYYYNKKDKKIVNLDSLGKTFTSKRFKEIDSENDLSKEKQDSIQLHKTLFAYNDDNTKLILHKDGDIKKKYIKDKHDISITLTEDNKPLWDMPVLQPEKNDNVLHNALFLDKIDKTFGILRYNYGKKKDDSEILICDLESGTIKHQFEFNTDRAYKYRDYFNLQNKNITVLSSVVSWGKLMGINFNKFNIEDSTKVVRKNFRWEEAAKYIDVNAQGGVENGLELRLINYVFLKNGNVGILSEKHRVKSNGVTVTTDYVFFIFDAAFNLINATVIDKDKSKGFGNIDYLFSQNVEGGSIIFYRDYKKDEETKDKNWILGIITYINGEFGHQTLPMTSEEYNIIPFLAKEGYVLLAEFNAKEKKYNKIRLEKINL